jgi:hypothetical protein
MHACCSPIVLAGGVLVAVTLPVLGLVLGALAPGAEVEVEPAAGEGEGEGEGWPPTAGVCQMTCMQRRLCCVSGGGGGSACK